MMYDDEIDGERINEILYYLIEYYYDEWNLIETENIIMSVDEGPHNLADPDRFRFCVISRPPFLAIRMRGMLGKFTAH